MLLTLVLLPLQVFVVDLYTVPSDRMAPTLAAGDLIVARKWGHGRYGAFDTVWLRTEPSTLVERADVVVYDSPRGGPQRYVGRVIGIAGDTVEYRGESLSVNGERLGRKALDEVDDGRRPLFEEKLDGHVYRIALVPPPSPASGSITVPDGHLFIVRDNRNRAGDSRHLGPVPRTSVSGTLWKVL